MSKFHSRNQLHLRSAHIIVNAVQVPVYSWSTSSRHW